MKQYILENLDCPNCAAEIENVVKRLDCVRDAKVVFPTKTLMVDTSDMNAVSAAIAEIEPEVEVREKNSFCKKYNIKNLDCAVCAEKMEQKLKELPCVREAKISFAAKTLDIDTDNMDLVKKTVSDIEKGVSIEEAVSDENEFNIKKELFMLGALLGLFALSLACISFAAAPLSYAGYALLVAVYIAAGRDVIADAFKNILKGRVFNENFLMTFATLAAFAIGSYSEAAAVMLFYRAGEFFQDMAVSKSRRSIKSLMEVRPDYANIIVNGKEMRVAPERVKIGDITIVKAGEKVALDGTVIKGKSSVDSRALTGESVPRGVSAGDKVMSGMINLTGIIEVKVEKLFSESSASKILDLVENAAANKAKTETFITKFAAYYTPAVFLIAFAVAVIPPLLDLGGFGQWIYRALVVLVVSCPCALVISVPLGYFGGIGCASRNGILIKGSNFLEALSDVKAAAFDKTGTLTKGVFKVTDVAVYGSYSKDDILKYAGIAESRSGHPIAKSIVEAAGFDVSDISIDEYEEISGKGVKVLSGGKIIAAGNDKLLHTLGISHSIDVCGVKGSVAHIAIDNEYAGYIVISDELKEDTVSALDKLKSAGVADMAVLTGDNEYAAASILKGTGITSYYCDLLPEDKADKFKEFADKFSNGGKVIFTGDGINDAPVIAMADIGVSMGGIGADAAIETADMVIMNDSLLKIYDAVKIAKKTKAIIWQNIIFALAVKALFIILGLFGVASMWEAVFGDVGVALIALLNAMRVLRYEPE